MNEAERCKKHGVELVLDATLSGELGFDEYFCPHCSQEWEKEQEDRKYEEIAAEYERETADEAERIRKFEEHWADEIAKCRSSKDTLSKE